MKTKKCFKCNIEKEITMFYPHTGTRDKHLNKCKECSKKDSLNDYHGVKHNLILFKLNKDNYDERHNFDRLSKYLFKNIKRRIIYSPHGKYKNRTLNFSFKEFDKFIKSIPNLKKMHNKWVKSGYSKKLSLSVDRINNEENYNIDNIQIITLSENVRKARLIDYKINRNNKGQFIKI